MRIAKVLHRNILNSVESLHQTRASALVASIEALLIGRRLSVTALGRAANTTARTKHSIKRMDRLASNTHLQRERFTMYRALCQHLCAHLARPIIVVDWTDVVEQDRVMLLRGALVVDGRSLTLYESVYPLKQYNRPRTHQRFLRELHALLPRQCRPIIVTDAGFRGPWFRAVESLGWWWLGRVRNCINYRLDTHAQWRQSTGLYRKANSKPTYLGYGELSSRTPYACHLYLYKKRSSHRHAKRTRRHAEAKVFRKQQTEPWLLATNCPPGDLTSKDIVKLYGKRMQIELAFRDLKSERYGFGLTLARSRRIERLNVLMLIAALATLCLWWIGLHAKSMNWHRHFQANTVKHRSVLSTPFLALAVLARTDYVIKFTELIRAQTLLLALITQAHER